MTEARNTIVLLSRDVDSHYADIVAEHAHSLGMTLSTLDPDSGPDRPVEQAASALMTIGGDGTFLNGARWASRLGIPIFGVNTGRLGFLAELDPHDLQQALESCREGEYGLGKRPLISSVLADESGAELWSHTSLNDVVMKTRGVAVGHFTLVIDEEPCAEIQGDGVIVATPTGSTAYALSAGGPIVAPTVGCLLVVPLAPHALVPRSLVVDDSSTIQITVTHGTVLTAADALFEREVPQGSTLTAARDGEVEFVEFGNGGTFYNRLHDTMLFGAPLRMREEPVQYRRASRTPAKRGLAR